MSPSRFLAYRQLSGQLTPRGVGQYAALHFVPVGGVGILTAIHGDVVVPPWAEALGLDTHSITFVPPRNPGKTTFRGYRYPWMRLHQSG